MQTVEQRVSQRARDAAADLHLRTEAGDGPYSPFELKCAQNIREGLNDHWDGPQAFARFEASLPPSAPVDALNGYRAAVSWIGADSWDGCSDCVAILKAARTADIEWDWAGDSDRIAAELAKIKPFVSAIPVSTGRHAPPSGIADAWQPRIGERVQVTEEVDDWREWQRTPLFVAGITAERGKEGLNVSVCEEWPLNTRSSGFTDDFWINRPFKRDMLRPDRSLDLSNKGVG